MNPQLTAKQPRVEVVDALRGFAVMAILLVHSVEHFNFYIYPTDQPDWLAWLDRSVFCGVFALMAGKSYAIFALLFGFTFYVQWSNQRRQGRDFGYRFLWRLLLLVGFASLNSVFFMAGDVLLLFAAVGIILFLVRNCSDKVVLGLAVLFCCSPSSGSTTRPGPSTPPTVPPIWAWAHSSARRSHTRNREISSISCATTS